MRSTRRAARLAVKVPQSPGAPQAHTPRPVPGIVTGARPDRGTIASLQRSAGNQAVLTLLGVAVQRAPDVREKDASPAALADTVPGALADTAPGSAQGAAATSAPSPSRQRAVPVTEADVTAAYGQDPSRVLRSPRDDWHVQMYRLDAGTGAVPPAFRVGDIIAVHPDFAGPATELPHWAGADEAPAAREGHDPAAGGVPGVAAAMRPGSATVGTAPPPEPGAGRRVVGRPATWDTATPATEDEVAAVFEQDPSRVIRSPSHSWHEQIYDLDRGGGDDYPQVYRVGGQYVVSPDYPGPATPLPHYSAEPVAELAERRTPLGGSTTTVTNTGARTETAVRKRELAHWTASHEAEEDGVTERTERHGGATAGVDGTVLGVGAGGSRTTSLADDASATTSRNTGVGITSDARVKAGTTSTTELVVGTDEHGQPIRTSSSRSSSVSLGESGLGAERSRSSTSTSGTTTTRTSSGTADLEGNYAATGGGGVSTKQGLGAQAGVGVSHNVSAEEPVQVAPGVWEVRYVVTDATSASGGISGKAAGVGLGVGATGSSARLQTGSRRFASEKDALDFQKHAGRRVQPDLPGTAPVTTAAGALTIPLGEARGVGSASSSGGSVSVTAGASLSGSTEASSGQELSVRRVGETTVQVTTTVTAKEGDDLGISGLGLTNQKGGSTSTLHEVTYEFDLAAPEGAAAFEGFCAGRAHAATAGRRVVVRTLDSAETHDRYTFFGGTATFGGATWQERKETQAGTSEEYGGKQTRDQTPGAVLKLLGEDEIHASAQIVRAQTDDKDAGARAELTVSGDSGEANRAELAKIFGTAGSSGAAKASGRWTLSAAVPLAAIKELEAVSPRLRAARTLDEKMVVYSELVKQHGASMLGGQVGMTSSAWDLELKGDPNFPGPAGRERLTTLAKELRARLKKEPRAAGQVVREATEELAALQKRRTAVADPRRYTDLPGRLRKQQLAVIDGHVAALTAVRRNAQAVSMRGSGSADAVYGRLTEQIGAREARLGALRAQVRRDSRALGNVFAADGRIALASGVDKGDAAIAIALGKAAVARATAADARGAALDPSIDAARDAWTAATEPTARTRAAKELDQLLGERVAAFEECLQGIHLAARSIHPVLSPRAVAEDPELWHALGLVASDG